MFYICADFKMVCVYRVYKKELTNKQETCASILKIQCHVDSSSIAADTINNMIYCFHKDDNIKQEVQVLRDLMTEVDGFSDI